MGLVALLGEGYPKRYIATNEWIQPACSVQKRGGIAAVRAARGPLRRPPSLSPGLQEEYIRRAEGSHPVGISRGDAVTLVPLHSSRLLKEDYPCFDKLMLRQAQHERK